MMNASREIKYDASGLVPAIVQDAETNEVLMLAYMNAESLRLTIETGETYFWSRSRQELWHKGATSGNIQTRGRSPRGLRCGYIVDLVQPAGPACHTGNQTCFYREMAIPFDHKGH